MEETRRNCKSCEILREFPESCICVAQDALNAVLIDNWFCIEKKYNVLYQFVPRKLAKKELSTFLKEKVIIHFSLGNHKPWCALGRNRLSYLYHQYKRKSPRWYEKKYTDFQFTPPFVYKFVKTRFVETARNYPKAFAILSTIQHMISDFIELYR